MYMNLENKNKMNDLYFEWMKTPDLDVVVLATTHDKVFPSVIKAQQKPMLNRPACKEMERAGRYYMAPMSVSDDEMVRMADIADRIISDKKTRWKYLDNLRTTKTPER